MASMGAIRALAQQIGRQFNARRIILFGSHAYGRPTSDSDVDLLVVMPCRGRRLDKEIEIRLALRPPFPVDVLVRTPAQIARQVAERDCFIVEVISRGKLLYEATDAPVGGKSRSGFSQRAARAAGSKAAKSRRRVFSRAAVR